MTYTLECNLCASTWEVDAPMGQVTTGHAVHTCPKCERGTGQLIVTGGTGFVLKGNRWAKDNYGGKDNGTP